MIDKPFFSHEDGCSFASVQGLRLHLQQKTEWSDTSIVGARVAVMWHSDQWYQGTVTEFDPVRKKHCIEYGENGEHWCNMQSKLFYIVTPGPNTSSVTGNLDVDASERSRATGVEWGVSSSSSTALPSNPGTSSGAVATATSVESKQGGLNEVRRGKLFTSSYAVAQSLVHFAYGENIQQVGYRTDAHLCVTKGEKDSATIAGSSLLYGEILPQGVSKA